ncbi:MAG: hypothetical protein OXG58_02385 [Gemmatimonadetes bacterium]|nr:hypothetical protein [Gemmatimonadota bacterium]MCY3943415.1 hypothetical protein [Gemmatimonadota bacterium]
MATSGGAYAGETARELHAAAQRSWQELDESVARYSALIRQRGAVRLRVPLRDRVIYRNETAVRAFWQRGQDAVTQVLGARSYYPGRETAVREGDLDWLDDLNLEEPFEPGSDHLFFGMMGPTSEYPVAHPLAPGADSLYRFASGDTLTLSLPGGERFRAIRLDVSARRADQSRISGALWIEPESGALVRAVYRLSGTLELDRFEIEWGETRPGRVVPWLLSPATFDLSTVAVEYSLWERRAWLPRRMSIDAHLRAGILNFPVSMETSYEIESVTLKDEESAAQVAADLGAYASALEHVHFESREEALSFIARILGEGEGVAYESTSSRRDGIRLIAPVERELLAESPALPPPIWQETPGFLSEDELERFRRMLNAITVGAEVATAAVTWGWRGHDLLRYNRVEGPAVGVRAEFALPRGFRARASGFLGIADFRPKARLDLVRSSLLRSVQLSAFHELRSTDSRAGHLGLGNSLNALLWGRDGGQYYRATGASLAWRPPRLARASYSLSVYAERQSAVANAASFSVLHAFDSDWDFPANLVADTADEWGAELWLAPLWGDDPSGARLDAELLGRAALWRTPGGGGDPVFYQQASARITAVLPVAGDSWRGWSMALEGAVGTTLGDAPAQRSWFLGGRRTLRGYPPSVREGLSYLRGRIEVARTYELASLIVFGDAGWAGDVNAFEVDGLLYGAGVGASFLDGLFRLDLSRGLTGSEGQFRVEAYLDAPL